MNTIKFENNTVTVCPEGRIDSQNAAAFEEELAAAQREHAGCELVLDLDKLNYISSAGLRVLLGTSKRQSDPLRVINVSRELYEIFDMTGFTSILNVERKLRSISIEGCRVIGRGAIGTVYRIDNDTIVKVYDIPDALDVIKNEQKRAKHAFLKGIPTAISYDAVRVGDRYGSVFELLDAKTFVDVLNAEPDRLDELVKMHVQVMNAIHSIEAEPGELPDCREMFTGYLHEIGGDLPDDLRSALEARFRSMPEDLHMIHGDIHMKNVMLCGGEPLLIDMETLSTGDPVFDLADLFIAYCAFNEADPTNSSQVIGLSKDVCSELFEKTLSACLRCEDEAGFMLARKRIMTVGYVRFLYLVAVLNMGGEQYRSLRIRRTVEHLRELLPEVSSFVS